LNNQFFLIIYKMFEPTTSQKSIIKTLLSKFVPEVQEVSEFSSGYQLCLLVESLTNSKIFKKLSNPLNKNQKISNVTYAHDALEQKNIHVQCNSIGIVEGKEDAIWDLLWQLVKVYRLKEFAQDSKKSSILLLVQEKCKPHNIEIPSLDVKYFRSGLPFLILLSYLDGISSHLDVEKEKQVLQKQSMSEEEKAEVSLKVLENVIKAGANYEIPEVNAKLILDGNQDETYFYLLCVVTAIFQNTDKVVGKSPGGFQPIQKRSSKMTMKTPRGGESNVTGVGAGGSGGRNSSGNINLTPLKFSSSSENLVETPMKSPPSDESGNYQIPLTRKESKTEIVASKTTKLIKALGGTSKHTGNNVVDEGIDPDSDRNIGGGQGGEATVVEAYVVEDTLEKSQSFHNAQIMKIEEEKESLMKLVEEWKTKASQLETSLKEHQEKEDLEKQKLKKEVEEQTKKLEDTLKDLAHVKEDLRNEQIQSKIKLETLQSELQEEKQRKNSSRSSDIPSEKAINNKPTPIVTMATIINGNNNNNNNTHHQPQDSLVASNRELSQRIQEYSDAIVRTNNLFQQEITSLQKDRDLRLQQQESDFKIELEKQKKSLQTLKEQALQEQFVEYEKKISTMTNEHENAMKTLNNQIYFLNNALEEGMYQKNKGKGDQSARGIGLASGTQAVGTFVVSGQASVKETGSSGNLINNISNGLVAGGVANASGGNQKLKKLL